MDPTRVTVRLTARDYGAFIGLVVGRQLLLMQAFLGVAALLGLFPSWSRFSPNNLAITGAAVLGVLFVPMVWKAFLGWLTARRRDLWAVTDYEIREEGMYFKSAAEEGVRAWSSFHKAKRKGKTSYLFTGPFSAFIFPDHSFATAEDSVGFFDQLLERLKTPGMPVNWQANRPSPPPALDPATVNVHLEPKDIGRFINFLPVGKWRKFAIWVYIVAVSGVLLAAISEIGRIADGRSNPVHGNPLLWTLFSYIPPLIFLAILGASFWWGNRPSRYRKRMPDLFVPRRYTVSDEGLFCKGETAESITDWRAVLRFVETDRDFYLMVSKRNGIVLPKRCFSTREAAAIFANQVRLHLEKHAPAAVAAA